MKLTTHAHLVPSIGMNGAIPPSSHAFMAYARNKKFYSQFCSLNTYADFLLRSIMTKYVSTSQQSSHPVRMNSAR